MIYIIDVTQLNHSKVINYGWRVITVRKGK